MKACQDIEKIINLLKQPIDNKHFNKEFNNNDNNNLITFISKDEYLKIIQKAKDYINSRRYISSLPLKGLNMPFDLPPFNLYRSLRRLNPSPFLYYLNFNNFSVIGSSPEILVRVRDDKVTIRPIAGTRPRGNNTEHDNALANELLNDQKEISEHRMLLDLARNDVAKVSISGSLNVTEKMIIERYSSCNAYSF